MSPAVEKETQIVIRCPDGTIIDDEFNTGLDW
jgi:hypothetical protein